MRLRLLGPCLVLAFGGGCLFPEYTFDEVTGGSGGAPTSTGGAPQGAGGTGGAPQGGGGSGATGGTGGMPPVEDCFTAGDEDDNGSADCADPACAVDLECVPNIPTGWGTFGFVALYTGSIANDPACPEGSDAIAHLGQGDLINTSATCSACSCGSPAWGGCELDDYTAGTPGLQGVRTRNVPCATPGATGLVDLTVPDPWDLTCNATNSAPGGQTCGQPTPLPCNTSIQANLARPIDGTCLEGGGQPTGGEPTFTKARKACEADEFSGCDTGQRCVARFPAPYEGRVCVAKVGDVVCPSGFAERTVSYGGVDDSRTCSSCDCNPATGGTCKLTVSLFTDAACTSPVGGGTTVESNGCTNLTGNPTVAGRTATVSQAPAGGSCGVVPGGGTPSGTVDPTEPTTFCCLVD